MKKYFAEFLGTFILVFTACGAAGFSGGLGGYTGVLGMAVVFGITYMAVYAVIGSISGCHTNPAVSLAVLLSKKMSVVDFFAYVISQMFGGILAAFSLKAVTLSFNGEIIDNYMSYYGINFASMGTNGYGDVSAVGINMWGALAVEGILTLIVVLTYLAANMEREYRISGGIMAGLALIAVSIMGIPLTGAGVNPARSFAPAFVTYIFGDATALAQEWVFIAGPLIGGIIAAAVWALLNIKRKSAPDDIKHEGIEETQVTVQDSTSDDTAQKEETAISENN